MTYNKKDIRKAFKAINYKVKFKTYSDFIATDIINAKGDIMPSMFTSDTLAAFKQAIDLKNTLKGQCFDSGYRVVI